MLSFRIASASTVLLMWRNNVRRCGHCYHTARRSHVAGLFRRAQSTSALPIGNDEFMSAMRDGVFVKEKGDDVGKNLLGKLQSYSLQVCATDVRHRHCHQWGCRFNGTRCAIRTVSARRPQAAYPPWLHCGPQSKAGEYRGSEMGVTATTYEA